MNILFTSPTPFHPSKGGVGKVTDTLCREFKKRGYNVFYLHMTWYSEDRKSFPYPAPVTILPTDNIQNSENIAFYQKYLVQNQIDIIINQDGLYEGSYLFLQTGNTLVKTISVLHNNPITLYDYLWADLSTLKNNTILEKVKRTIRCLLFFKLKYQAWQRIQQHFGYLLSHTDILLVLSTRYESTINRINPKLLPLTQTIYNPNTYIEQKQIPSKTKEIIYVGRLVNNQKRVNRLLEIWSYLYKHHPDWHLSIIGDGNDADSLKNEATQLQLQRITFHGFKDPRSFYEKASIICMTSNFEGFPMVLTEAMQFGCVPIAFNSFEAIKDVIIPGITGELISPFHIHEYKSKMERLITDTTYRELLAKNAFEHVRQFNAEKIVDNWIKLFDEI